MRRRRSLGGGFSPRKLFADGTVGAWYDPSDYSTLFQDSAGTTPVTAVEQPVGLMLDKSQGLVLGSEVVVNGDFATNITGWTSVGTPTLSWNAGRLQCVATGASGTSQQLTLVVGRWYRVVGTIQSPVGVDVSLGILNNAETSFIAETPRAVRTTATQVSLTFLATETNSKIYMRCAGAGTFFLDDASVKELPGNHASQATAASRPVLRARYNNLTYSEQFDNAAWTKGNSTVTANQTTAPDGTTTADLLYPSTSGATRWIYQALSAASAVYTRSVYAKAQNKSIFYIDATGAGTVIAYFNLSSGTVGTVPAGYTATITAVGSGWYRCTMTNTSAAVIAFAGVYGVADADGSTSVTANGTDGIYIWGAQLVTGSSAGTYQRIAAATDYDTVGFLPYLYFDGSDDYLTIANTNDLNFGQGSFWAQTGLTSLGASQYDVVWGKNSASNDNIRLFLHSADILAVFWGTDAQNYIGSTFQITKNTAQIQEWGVNSSGPTAFYALNGTENTPAITLSGTGSNSAPAYIGINNNLTQYQTQMNLYGMILRKGTLPTAAQRTASRNWMAAKSGVTL